MGYIRHHAILVTSWSQPGIEAAHAEAESIFASGEDTPTWERGPWVSPISPKATNGYRSFFVAPDGSKEGWGESELGDQRREQFVGYLRSQCYEDGSSNLRWAEVMFGDDGRQAAIIRHSGKREEPEE